MSVKIQHRRETAANWTSVNPTLAQGEIGYETDTLKHKIGTGSTVWTGLAYVISGSVLGVTAGSAIQVDQTVTAWTRSATTTLGTTINGTLSDTSTTITAFNGVAGVTYHCRALGAGSITHHATDLIITQTGASVTTAAGDTFDVEMLTGTTCRVKNYIKATGKALVESVSLAGNTFTAGQIYSDQQASRAMLIDCGYTVLDKGSVSSGTATFDYTAGSVQTWTNGGAHTVATSNWPPTGNLGEMLLIGTNLGSAAITWPTISWMLPAGTTSTSIATYLAANTGRTALATSGVDQILLWSRDAGTTIYGKLV